MTTGGWSGAAPDVREPSSISTTPAECLLAESREPKVSERAMAFLRAAQPKTENGSSVCLADRQMQNHLIEQSPESLGGPAIRVPPRRVQRNEDLTAQRVCRRRDDRELLGSLGVVTQVHANRTDRRFVAESDAGRDRSSSMNDVAKIRQILESAPSDDRAVEKRRPFHFPRERNAEFHASLHQRRSAHRTRREILRLQRTRIRIAQPNGRFGRGVATRHPCERVFGNGQNARAELVFVVAANRVRAACVESLPRVKQLDSRLCARQRAHEPEA